MANMKNETENGSLCYLDNCFASMTLVFSSIPSHFHLLV
jgi:hypothetical protein